jgi:diguanylate cyclase (GGDEF)-like protein
MTERNIPLLETALKNLQDLLITRTVLPEPPEELAAVEGYAKVYEMLLEIRTAILAFAAGDMSYKIRHKGIIPGSVKALQAALQHLTWQTKMIASGDFTQRVDFMGEFSESFNSMVIQLDESMRKLTIANTQLHDLNLRLELLAHTDPLTGISNRGYFMELLDNEFERARRYGRVFSVLMFDLDHFKTVNDTRGHAAGDEALRSLCTVFQESGLRKSDFFGRIGGEEFALAVPETGIHAAAETAERIRGNLENNAVSHDGKVFFITASIGVSEYRDGDTPEAVLNRADKAMYRAKEEGRNRVCCEEESLL